VVDAYGLHRIALAELPAQIVGGDELPEPWVERGDVVVLEVDLDEGFPVVIALLDFDPVEHVAGEIEVAGDTDSREIARDIARPVEQEAVPVREGRAVELDAGLLFEVRRAKQLPLEVVRPPVQRTDDVLRV